MLKLLKKIHMNTWIAVLSYLLTFAFLYSATVRATHEPMGSAMFSAFLSVGFFIPVNFVMSAIAKLGVRIVNRVRSDAEATNEADIVDDTAPGRTHDRRFRLARPGATDVTYERSPSNNVSPAASRD